MPQFCETPEWLRRQESLLGFWKAAPCSLPWQLLTQVRGHLHAAPAVPKAQVIREEVSNEDGDALERGTEAARAPPGAPAGAGQEERVPRAAPPAGPHRDCPGPPPPALTFPGRSRPAGAGPGVSRRDGAPGAARSSRGTAAPPQPCPPAPRRASPRAAAWAGCRCPGEAA